MSEHANLAGNKYAMLTVLHSLPSTQYGCNWACVCECGTFTTAVTSWLLKGNKRSCGCIRRKPKKHGLSNTPEWSVWTCMLDRCRREANRNYRHYGGRGITVCERWLAFENFFADMGRRPSDQHSIDRIDNDRGYEPSNCRWATQSEQVRNRRCSNHVTIDGVTRIFSEWCVAYGIPRGTVWSRVDRGWDLVEAITTPRGVARRKAYP